MKMKQLKVYFSADASGAYEAGLNGHIVVIVDVIDMSTSLETAMEMGATAVFGSSPDKNSAPVPVNPEKIATVAASLALQLNTEIIIIGEPRFASKFEHQKNSQRLINKLSDLGAKIYDYVPNIGKEISGLTDFTNRIVIAATNTGGVAFDTAYNAGGITTTATIARTGNLKGKEPALKGALRAYKLAIDSQKNISFVAASSNSLEDVLAAKYLCELTKGLS
ncbi:MAG: hypothetical protein APF76_07680 [Desulfitibacter sp. BRH_c19]|nr:MAG: hypothetical protein APF76_07680 [Desulfitibacter sp. BRH_c19]